MMNDIRRTLFLFCFLLVFVARLQGQDGTGQDPAGVDPAGLDATELDAVKLADEEPFLRVEAGGPQSYITAMAFDPTGNTLYAAGWDKAVHVWRRDPQTHQFVLQPNSTFRLPIGPGLLGAINAMTVSSDGRWLAVGGYGIFRGTALFRQPGRAVPSDGLLTPEMRRDEGTIYVFDTRENTVRLLRGHAGSVLSLAFAPGKTETPLLISAAREWQEDDAGTSHYVGMVRAWNVLAEPDQMQFASRILAEPTSRPSLAVRRVGSDLTEIELALAWGDDKYRLWDVASDRLTELPGGVQRYAVGFSQAADGFIAGLFGANDSRVSGVLELRKPADVAHALPLETGRPDTFLVPRVIAVAPGDKRGDVVLVLSRRSKRKQEANPDKFVLQSARSGNGKLGELSGQCLLWDVPSTGAFPAMAVAPDRSVVAVAGNVDHSIWLYPMDGIKLDAKPSQVLRNSGSNWQHVTFARSNNHRGVVLRNATTSVAFDLEDRLITDDVGPWEDDFSDAGDWRVNLKKQNAFTVVVIFRDKSEVSRTTLPEGEVISAYAFSPNSERSPDRPTILAIASHHLGQAALRLYNAETGEPFRQLTGHSQPISGLSFDTPGLLLASVAGDQTVCLWDLSDWGTVIGRRGMLPGTAVGKMNSGNKSEITVTAIRETAPSEIRRGLSKGDRLQSVTLGNDTQAWSEVREFFDAFWAIPPATPVSLKVIRQGKELNIPLRVGQGVDERKPKLSVFISVPSPDQRREWVAWSPMGPYEASGRDAERFLGWQFNTGDGESPTRFAPAEEYRKTYYHDGLVRELVSQGALSKRLMDPPAAITLRFGSESRQQQAAGEGLIIRSPPRTVHIHVGDFASEYIDSVEVVVGDRIFKASTPPTDNEWVINLNDLEWKRGTQQYRSIIRTKETPTRQFIHDTSVHSTPLPPQIESSHAPHQIVETAKYPLVVDIESPSDEPLFVRWSQNGRVVDQSEMETGSGRIERELTLEPGDNVIECRAVNRGAPLESQDSETAVRAFRVTYQKAIALPPKITVSQLQTFDNKTGEWSSVSQESDESDWVVSRPRLRIQGTIQAAQPVSSAGWVHQTQPGTPSVRQALATEKGEEANVWQFSQIVQLEPGKQRINFSARSADSDEATFPLVVNFHPSLPEIVLDAELHSNSIDRDANDPPVEVQFAGKWITPDPVYPFEARIMINDQPLATPEISHESPEFSVTIPLQGGQNRIRMELRNRWGARQTSDTRVVNYRRLPRVLAARHSRVGREPFTEVTAEIESPAEIPLTQIQVGGRALDNSTWRKIKTEKSVTVWQATARNVPLQPGKNTIQVSAANGDGGCRKSVLVEAFYDANFWNPAQIDVLNAAPSTSVADSAFELKFRVSSASPLRIIRVDVNEVPLPLAKLTAGAPQTIAGKIARDIAAKLLLNEGTNRIVVVIQNEGGESHEKLEISYVSPPVRIKIASLEPDGYPEKALQPIVNGEGQVVFEKPLTSGYARLKGTVEWNRPSTRERAASPELRIWANGFQQDPISLKGTTATKDFSAVVILGESKNNQVTLDLTGVAQDAQNRVAFTVDCLEPQPSQRLHLLIIAAQQRDPDALMRRALAAVRAEVDADGKLKQPLRAAGFFRINTYRPLTNSVSFSDVFRLLLEVKSALKIPLGADSTGRVRPINDVVMLYYEGGILVPEKEHFVLRTSDRYDSRDRFSGISSEWLAEFFDSMRGAKLAFIDVETEKPPSQIPVTDWNHDSHAALLCFAWPRGVDAPEDLRLMRAFDQALGTARRLGEVDAELANLSATSPGLDYNRVLPERLKSLVLFNK